MATAQVRGLNINYEIVGTEGPAVALITGGRRAYGEFLPLAEKIAMNGFRVFLTLCRPGGQGRRPDFAYP